MLEYILLEDGVSYLLLEDGSSKIFLEQAEFEDFTTYTEVDPGSDLTVVPARITLTNQPRTSENYVYFDFGADYFSNTSSWSIDFVVNHDTGSSNDSAFCPFVISDTLGAFPNGQSGTSCWLAYAYWANAGSHSYWDLQERVSGVVGGEEQWDNAGSTLGIVYYTTLEMDPNTGSFGTLYWRLYSDVGRTTLVRTLTCTLTADGSFRYLILAGPYFDGSAPTTNGYVENMVITMGEAGTTTDEIASTFLLLGVG